MATKTQLWTNVQNDLSSLFETNKVSKKFQDELLTLLELHLAPQSGGASKYPPKLNDKGEIVEAWCRFHERYEPIENMVVSKGKSKGYCKASISKWNKTNSNIKSLESQAVGAMTKGDFESAQKLAESAQALKSQLNRPDYYDFDKDWAIFNS